MNHPIVFCIAAALVWGMWPVVVKFSNLTSAWVAFLVPLASVGVAGVALTAGSHASTFPSGKAITIGLAAGILNGFGFVAFGRLLGAEKGGWDVSTYATAVYALLPLVTMLGAVFVLREPMTVAKAIGMVLVLAGIWLIAR